jgi:hypothetical protein
VGDDGVGGVIVVTSNGGAAWAGQSVGASAKKAWLTGVAFSDATHGWAVGNWGAILATTNGGATWSAQSPGSSEYLNAVAFGDAVHGWVVGWNGVVLATTNGGLPSAPAPGITKLKPASAKRGALITISGTGFGAARGTNAVKVGGKTCTSYASWSATTISCKVPAATKLGAVKVTVTTAAGTSNAVNLTVKR